MPQSGMDLDHADALQELAARACARLRAAGCAIDAGDEAAISRLAIASDFAIATLVRQPGLLATLQADAATPLTPPLLDAGNRADWGRLLRLHRQAESTRMVWRDVLEHAPVEEILAASTALADGCLQLALDALETEMAQRFGVVRAADGSVQRLVVFGLGKLGGGELNFSSDVDLVYAYEHEGESDGARSLDAQDWFARLGQQLAKLLDEVTADGFSHRVDLRLRPFGNAGRVALSFAAMEHYFLTEGRDWERYAWQKARPVAGDLAAGERLLQALRPFVYRRYLDYGALDGLRTMKAAIAAEVARKDMADDIKRGPGGIREIEFLVQALQLIRGGRELALRERRLLPAMRALVAGGHVDAAAGDLLLEAYRFLRTLENRLQMLGDAQTHALPADALRRARIADGLGYPHWQALLGALAVQRERVSAEFDALLAARREASGDSDLASYWRGLPDAGDGAVLVAAGFEAGEDLHRSLADFARVPAVRTLSDATRARLDRVLPALLQAAVASPHPDAVLRRLLPLLHMLLRRASYLALLDEQPVALHRLVDALSRSALLGERLAAHPLLLDELLDVRIGGELPGRAAMHQACAAALGDVDTDTEAALNALNEIRQALSFRIALALLDRRIEAQECARRLAWLADAVVDCVLKLALAGMHAAHGGIDGAQFAVLGYGSLGGEELGFGSDLDLVFLYDAAEGAASDGARPLDASRWFARLGQKIVALLETRTGAGRLFEIDVRLRPDGAKGLLVSSLASFSDYQRERAWTWEHQALVRARAIAGDAALRAAFDTLRGDVLMRDRDTHTLREDVSAMRRRMRAELDRSDAALFDLKQGDGGLVDLEFLLQFLLLRESRAHPALRASRASPAILDALHDASLLDANTRAALQVAHATLLDAGMRCTLDRRPRRVARDERTELAREAIRDAVRVQGLQFEEKETGSE